MKKEFDERLVIEHWGNLDPVEGWDFVDGARWQWEKDQVYIAELESKLAESKAFISDCAPSWLPDGVRLRRQQLLEKLNGGESK